MGYPRRQEPSRRARSLPRSAPDRAEMPPPPLETSGPPPLRSSKVFYDHARSRRKPSRIPRGAGGHPHATQLPTLVDDALEPRVRVRIGVRQVSVVGTDLG